MLSVQQKMKFKKQKDTFTVDDALERLTGGSLSSKKSKHGPLLPDSIRCIVCGPSNCGKTNLMFSLLTDPKGLRFANLYVFSKSLQQSKYVLLSQLFKRIPEIGYYAFENSEEVKSPNQTKPNSVMVFDDVACDSQDHMRAYFSMGRHSGVDCFYLTQTYTRVPKHLLRDNANLIVLFKQDDINLRHIYDEHVGTDMSFIDFKEMCGKCWNKSDHGFVVICKDAELNNGRYRCGFDIFITDV